ncbi:hypothetical protein [Comamonas sp.]|uniref:hypothetical protein n=1 Tax=Comamonas sp. TaxID=34028 RepID=UPI002898D541|nr:hypothetical protein [Comamonas sp.]
MTTTTGGWLCADAKGAQDAAQAIKPIAAKRRKVLKLGIGIFLSILNKIYGFVCDDVQAIRDPQPHLPGTVAANQQ